MNTPNIHSPKRKHKYSKKLYTILYTKPISRRMAATLLGYPDQTYMVTQIISDWLTSGKAQVVGRIKCDRSGRFAEAISTNPELFKSIFNNDLKTFE